VVTSSLSSLPPFFCITDAYISTFNHHHPERLPIYRQGYKSSRLCICTATCAVLPNTSQPKACTHVRPYHWMCGSTGRLWHCSPLSRRGISGEDLRASMYCDVAPAPPLIHSVPRRGADPAPAITRARYLCFQEWPLRPLRNCRRLISRTSTQLSP
jgi:hypothetical protein